MEVPTIGSGNMVETFTYRQAERVALPSSQLQSPPPTNTVSRSSALKATKSPKAAAVVIPEPKMPPTAVKSPPQAAPRRAPSSEFPPRPHLATGEGIALVKRFAGLRTAQVAAEQEGLRVQAYLSIEWDLFANLLANPSMASSRSQRQAD